MRRGDSLKCARSNFSIEFLPAFCCFRAKGVLICEWIGASIIYEVFVEIDKEMVLREN